MMKKCRSLKVNTLIYLVLFSVFILLLLWYTQSYLSEYLYEKYQIKDMNKIANEVYNSTSEELPNYLINVVYNNSICIEYRDIYGNITLYNDKSTGCLLGKNNEELVSYKESLYQSGEDMKAIKLVNPDYHSYALLYGVKVSGGYVYLFTMLSSVNKNDSLINSQLIYITFVIIILAVFISLFLSKVISEPIVKITNKSKELAKGNFSVIFEKNGIQEIDNLADSLNYLESEVSKTDQYRRDLLANVSHDLKTPLTMIKAYAEMVRDISYKNKKKREEHLNVIIEETDRLNLLVSDILTLSKLQAKEDILEYEEFDLVLEIQAILKRFDWLVIKENYSFACTMPERALVYADKNKIYQVIYNLINNAINYTGEDKKVFISLKEQKKTFLVEIKDTGKGIKEEEIAIIWDKYYKNEKNHKRNKVGTGLGLSIVKNILVNHHFPYGVQSEEGKGTTFYFKINKKSYFVKK